MGKEPTEEEIKAFYDKLDEIATRKETHEQNRKDAIDNGQPYVYRDQQNKVDDCDKEKDKAIDDWNKKYGPPPGSGGGCEVEKDNTKTK
jgi:hypothetical protein